MENFWRKLEKFIGINFAIYHFAYDGQLNDNDTHKIDGSETDWFGGLFNLFYIESKS